MAIEEFPDVRKESLGEEPVIAETGGISLEEFKASLIKRGFEVSPRNPSIYLNPNIPGFRFVIRKRVVRLENENPSTYGREWQLDSSYLISSQLRMAIKAIDHLGIEPEIINDRKVISSPGEIIAFLGLGSILVFGGLLVVLIPELINRFIGVLFLVLGTLILVHVKKVMISRKILLKSDSRMASADVIDRQEISKNWAGVYAPSSIEYFLILGFTPSELESSGQRIWIKAQVKEHIYRSHIRGSSIGVHYSCADPRYLILEVE
jgi:hypothetical protein